MTQEVLQVRPDALHLSPLHRRTNWGDLAALTESVREVGVLEPVLIRMSKGGTYELVCGARRKRAAESAGLRTVPAIVKEISDEQVIEIQLHENLQREGLHPVDEAELFEYAVKYGMSVEKIAARHGLTPAHVKQRLQLCHLTPELREQYKAGVLHHSVAFAASRIPAVLQDQAVEEMQAVAERWREGDLAEDLEQLCWGIRDRFMTSLGHAPFAVADETLPPRACTGCPNRSDAQYELFPELITHPSSYCLEPACFQGKVDESWKRARADAEAKGLVVLEGADAKKAQTTTVSPDATAIWTSTGTPKTYQQVVKGVRAKVEPVLVQGDRGEPELRYPKKEAQRALKQYEEKNASKLMASPRAQSSAAAERERKRRELQSKIVEAALSRIGVVGSEKAPKALWQAVLDVVLALCVEAGTGESVLEAGKARGMAIEDGGIDVDAAALRTWATSEAKARGLALELLAREIVPTWRSVDEWPEAFRHLCAVLELDLVALEAELMPAPGQRKAKAAPARATAAARKGKRK